VSTYDGSFTGVRELLCELLRLFYDKGWVSGTGGGICALEDPGRLLLAPTGVHKERVQPDDLFVVSLGTGEVLEPPKNAALRPSEWATSSGRSSASAAPGR